MITYLSIQKVKNRAEKINFKKFILWRNRGREGEKRWKSRNFDWMKENKLAKTQNILNPEFVKCNENFESKIMMNLQVT